MREPSEALQRARRAVDGLPGVVSVGRWEWSSSDERWALPLKLRHGTPATNELPEETAWRVGLSCGGRIKVYVEKLG